MDKFNNLIKNTSNIIYNVFRYNPIQHYYRNKLIKYYNTNEDLKIVNFFVKKQNKGLLNRKYNFKNSFKYYSYIILDNQTNLSFLHHIIKDNKQNLFNYMVEKCPFIVSKEVLENDNNTLNLTPLQFACAQNKDFFLEALYELGANYNVLTSGGMNILHLSTYSGSIKCMQKVFDIYKVSKLNLNKSIINSETKDKQTSLHIACIFNKIDASSLLLEYNCDLYCRDSINLTPIEQAALNNNSDLMIILLKFYYNLSKLYYNKDSNLNSKEKLIHLAASSKKGVDCISALCKEDKSNANMVCNSKIKSTPLIFAVLNNNYKAVYELLLKGALVEMKDYLGNTPLHYAVEKQNEKIIKLLINYGANINTKNNENLSPLNIVNGKENKNLKLYFIALTGKKNKTNSLSKEDFIFKNKETEI